MKDLYIFHIYKSAAIVCNGSNFRIL